jgi:hypothetical protein
VPIRRHRHVHMLVVATAMIVASCGSQERVAGDLPPLPPTMTPMPAAPAVVTPAPEPVGEILEPLEDGQEVIANDQRYSIVMPPFWVPGSAPGADVAYRESGSTPVDHGWAYNVMREQLPAGISGVEDYAESGRQAIENTFAEVETMSLDLVQIDGVQAVRWVYTVTVTTDSVMVHQIYLVDGGTGFLLTGSAPTTGDLGMAHSLFDSIAASFTLPRG